MSIEQDVKEAVKNCDYAALRVIAERLSFGDNNGDKEMADRVSFAAAVVEVAVRGEELGIDDTAADRWVFGAVDACAGAIGLIYPDTYAMTQWVMRDDGEE